MVVVVILGILAALVVPKIISRPDDARVMAARQDIASIKAGTAALQTDTQQHPSTEQGLQALIARGPTGNPAPRTGRTAAI